MAQVRGLKILALGTGLVAASVAHAQVPVPAVAGPAAILGLVTAGKTGVDSLQSFAVFREKISSDDPERKIEPFFAAALPADAKGFADLEGWKNRKLKCEFHHADPGLGALSVAWTQNDLAKKFLDALSGGALQPREFWAPFSVSFFYTLSFDYAGKTKSSRGQFLNNVLIQRDYIRVTQGWKFSVSPGKYEASNAGTAAAPIPKVRTLLRFRVEDAFGAASEMSQIYAFYGDGQAKRESGGEVEKLNPNIQTFCRPVKDSEVEREVESFKFN